MKTLIPASLVVAVCIDELASTGELPADCLVLGLTAHAPRR